MSLGESFENTGIDPMLVRERYQPVNPEDYPNAPKAIKDHNGKPRLDLIPFEALESMAAGFEHGSHKQGRSEWDWIKGTDWSLYVGSLLRHAAAIARGELIDPEDGVSHAGKIMANAAILETYRLHRIGNNNIRGANEGNNRTSA